MMTSKIKNQKILYIITILLVCTTGFAFPCWNKIQPEENVECTTCVVSCQTTQVYSDNCIIFHPRPVKNLKFRPILK